MGNNGELRKQGLMGVVDYASHRPTLIVAPAEELDEAVMLHTQHHLFHPTLGNRMVFGTPEDARTAAALHKWEICFPITSGMEARMAPRQYTRAERGC